MTACYNFWPYNVRQILRGYRSYSSRILVILYFLYWNMWKVLETTEKSQFSGQCLQYLSGFEFPIRLPLSMKGLCHENIGDVTRDDSQRRLLAQHSVTALLLHCFESPQYFTNIWTGAIPHLLEGLLLISWENNRDCHITMPLSLKIMEVQIKEEIRGSEWCGSTVWTLCCARNRYCESSRVILPYVPLPV